MTVSSLRPNTDPSSAAQHPAQKYHPLSNVSPLFSSACSAPPLHADKPLPSLLLWFHSESLHPYPCLETGFEYAFSPPSVLRNFLPERPCTSQALTNVWLIVSAQKLVQVHPAVYTLLRTDLESVQGTTHSCLVDCGDSELMHMPCLHSSSGRK